MKSSFIRNVSYSLAANIVVLLVTALVTLIFPKRMTVDAYSWFQLFLLYIGYAGLFHLGLCDGLYITIAGKQYDRLDMGSIRHQARLMNLLHVFFAVILVIFLLASNIEKSRKFVVAASGLCVLITNNFSLISFILQGTERLREYAVMTVISKAVYFVISVLLLLFFHDIPFEMLISANIAGLVFALLFGLVKTKDIWIYEGEFQKEYLSDWRSNVSSGAKLLLANLSGMLVNAIIRLGIERNWSIIEFGKVSLSLSLTNFIGVFISAVSVVFFPILKRMENNQREKLYNYIRDILMPLIFGIMVFFFPVQKLLKVWLPNYADSLDYLAILLPISAFSSKSSILITTYMKAYKMEKHILYTNLISIAMAVFCVYVFAFKLNSMIAIVASYLAIIAFKSMIQEILLSKKFSVNIVKDIVLDIFVSGAFCFSFSVISNRVNGIFAIFCYCVVFLLYLLIKQKDIHIAVEYLLKMFRRDIGASKQI